MFGSNRTALLKAVEDRTALLKVVEGKTLGGLLFFERILFRFKLSNIQCS